MLHAPTVVFHGCKAVGDLHTQHDILSMITGGLLGRYSQPNGGLLGLSAGLMAVLATAGLVNQVVWSSSMGSGASLAWAAAGALSTWLFWRHQVHLTEQSKNCRCGCLSTSVVNIAAASAFHSMHCCI